MASWTTSDIPPQTGRTAVVTGTGGIGFHIATALARAGANVIVAGRNGAKGAAAVEQIRRSAPRAQVRFGQADLASLASIDAFADALCRSYGVDTPEDPFPIYRGEGGPAVIASTFTLYDYSFRPDDIAREQAVAWAAEAWSRAFDRVPPLSRDKLRELGHADWVCRPLPAGLDWRPEMDFAKGFAATAAWYGQAGWL